MAVKGETFSPPQVQDVVITHQSIEEEIFNPKLSSPETTPNPKLALAWTLAVTALAGVTYLGLYAINKATDGAVQEFLASKSF